MDKYEVQTVLLEPMLGTAPLDPNVYLRWIIERAAKEGVTLTEAQIGEELDSLEQGVDAELLKGTTGFHRLADGKPGIMDYTIKGFLKEACKNLRKVNKSASSGLKAYRQAIDGLVFVKPRIIPIEFDGETDILERPLRAQTMQGERVTLARSETVPAGAMMTFTVLVLGEVTEQHLREWFDYGELHGLGCWRNATWGTFTYSLRKA